ncbi:MAG: methylated-DNA--[protein]-cysteine S-methyltransferase [Candidatus Margulisiibacteriota bacterium]
MKLWEQKILDAVAKIPRGRVSTYGLVAKASGVNCARLVGRALHHNPDPLRYPCHRVVFADGSLSKNFAFGGKTGQKRRLIEEGVGFTGSKVDLKQHLAFV